MAKRLAVEFPIDRDTVDRVTLAPATWDGEETAVVLTVEEPMTKAPGWRLEVAVELATVIRRELARRLAVVFPMDSLTVSRKTLAPSTKAVVLILETPIAASPGEREVVEVALVRRIRIELARRLDVEFPTEMVLAFTKTLAPATRAVELTVEVPMTREPGPRLAVTVELAT